MSSMFGKPVLVTTAHKGVFFGYFSKREGTTVHLTRSRNCIYWPAENRGFLGLAKWGPLEGARIGPEADIELLDVTSIAQCTDEAVQRWEAAPWSE